MNTSTRLARKFWAEIDKNAIDIHMDSVWPEIAEKLIAGKKQKTQLDFWLLLEQEFLARESSTGRCHKGQIYWKTALLFLLEGDLELSIKNLDLSSEEDKITFPGVTTSAINLSSVVKPLLENFDRRNGLYKINDELKSFYADSSPKEKRDFANALFNFHDNAIFQRAYTIGPSYFGFVVDKSKREIVRDTYFEISNILRLSSPTYYSCVFSMGSVLEAMLDDFFERKIKNVPQKMWEECKLLDSSEQGCYPANRFMLGNKLALLRTLSENGKNPLPRDSVMFMTIIGEYRNLIHPNRRMFFKFSPTGYVAKMLFSFISSIAHYYWPRRIGQRV